ncbi:hypothetical protein IST495A_05924 [Burkholderia multivorans]|nr:hypothetical protein IST495A_05924 [Burkholderia multivorans]
MLGCESPKYSSLYTPFSISGMFARVANSTNSRLRSSGIWKPNGFWKFGITMHAAIGCDFAIAASAAMSIPYSGCVATSIAFIPIRSIACSIA